MLPHAWWLLAGVVGMYVYDAVLLLYHNEIVFYRRRDGRWSFSAGSDFELAGRYVYIPSLLGPDRPVLRLRWSSQRLPAKIPALRGLRAWLAGTVATSFPVALIAVLFCVMPAVLFTTVWVLLGWMLALYVAIAFAVWRAWRMRRFTALDRKGFASLASDALLCAPYALNIVRKQGMHAAERFDLVAVAHALLDAGERARLTATIHDRLRRQMDLEDLDSERHAALQVYLQHIEGALA